MHPVLVISRPAGTHNEAPASSQAQVGRAASTLPMRRFSPYGIRHSFPTHQRPSPSTRPAKKSKVTCGDNRAFLRDLVLLSGPNDTVVPRQGARVLLSENGHIINGCQFTKSMSAAQVETRIMEVFDGKIPNLVDIELLMSVHNSLVIPNLAPDQKGIDGVIVHRLFKNKPVYIRPSCELLNFTQRQMRQSETQV